MTAFAFPNLEGGGVDAITSGAGGKIIQRIQPAAGSNPVKSRCMADADEDLVLQSKNGSLAAFETLIRNHQTMIHALTFRMTGSSADAEDLAQEAFIRAYEQIGRFNGGAKFSTWLYSIAVHACLNWRRNEARRFQAQADCAGEMLARQTDADNSPDEMAQAGAGGVDETARQAARGDCADDLRRIEPRGGGESFALFRNNRFVARVRREREIETLADGR